MVKLWCSAFDRIRVPARRARPVPRGVPDVPRLTRPSAATIGGGYTGHDHRTCCDGSRGSASWSASLAPAAEQLERSQSAILDDGDKCDDGINGWHDKSGFSLRTRYTM